MDTLTTRIVLDQRPLDLNIWDVAPDGCYLYMFRGSAATATGLFSILPSAHPTWVKIIAGDVVGAVDLPQDAVMVNGPPLFGDFYGEKITNPRIATPVHMLCAVCFQRIQYGDLGQIVMRYAPQKKRATIDPIHRACMIYMTCRDDQDIQRVRFAGIALADIALEMAKFIYGGRQLRRGMA